MLLMMTYSYLFDNIMLNYQQNSYKLATGTTINDNKLNTGSKLGIPLLQLDQFFPSETLKSLEHLCEVNINQE